MFVRLTNLGDQTPATAVVTVQGEADHLYVDPSDLPPWASPASANFALHRTLMDGLAVYLAGWVMYEVWS